MTKETKQLYGNELVLSILEKELVALTRKATKAKAECDATINAYSAIIEVRREASALIGGGVSDEKLTKLKDLADREKKLCSLSNRDLVKLMDAQHQADFTRNELAQIIANMKFRLELRGRRG